jgi:diadenosine tetraphosphate (Ap4A) HIT family hydrolase
MTAQEIKQKKNNSHRPIYSNGLFRVSHVTDYAIPGLYTTEPEEHKETFGSLDNKSVKSLAKIQRRLRGGLKSKFGIHLCGLYIEESPGKKFVSFTIPFHIDRLSEQFSVQIYQPHIEDYLKSYTNTPNQQIQQFDLGIKKILNNSKFISHIREEQIDLATNPAEKAFEIMEILEVFDEGELPEPPQGKKYYVCIGGNKNFQCFLSRDNVSKGEFISHHEDELDDCLKPVYVDNFVVVRQDAKYAIPGFYIVSPKKHYTRIDETPKDIFEKSMLRARDVRRVLSAMGINRAHIYHDEKYNSPTSVHFWVLPVYEKHIRAHKLNPTIFSKDIWTYLDTFPRFGKSKSQIQKFNTIMKQGLGKLKNIS